MKYDWILFDVDNTLLDFDGAAHGAFHSTLEELGVPCLPHYFEEYTRINKGVWGEFDEGKISQDQIRTLRFERFFSKISVSADATQFNEVYLAQLIQYSELIEGARPLLNQLASQVSMGIITNGMKESQRPRLKKTDITHFFEVIVVSDEIGVSKPHPQFFEHALKQMPLPNPEKILVVGDNLHTDIKGGNGVGLQTCWFNPKQGGNETPIQPDFEIHRLDDLVQHIT